MTGLPSFKNPPVSEVALAVQFESEPPLTSLDLVPLRSAFAADYPKAREVTPLPPMAAHSGAPILQFRTGPDTPRYWFLSNDEEHLVQLQSDRIAVNWRGRGDEPYPRYSKIRPRLEEAWANLSEHIERLGREPLRPDVAEVTYVNPIPAAGSGVWSRHDEIAKVFGHWAAEAPTVPGLEPTTSSFQLQFRMPEVDGGLSVTVDPVTDSTNGAIAFMMTLVARAEVTDRDFNSALAVLDHGREAIVTTFKAMTTEAMHSVWGLEP